MTEEEINVMFIGMPGSGKSTLSNLISDSPPFPREIFPTSSQAESVTQEIKSVCRNHEGYNVHYIDTPGFPDTDPRKARDLCRIDSYFDYY